MKKIALTLLTALTVSVLAGCSGSGAPAESTAAGRQQAQRRQRVRQRQRMPGKPQREQKAGMQRFLRTTLLTERLLK